MNLSFYPYSIKVNKCSGSCNNINDPYAELCVPDVVKNMNVKVFQRWNVVNVGIKINVDVNAKN